MCIFFISIYYYIQLYKLLIKEISISVYNFIFKKLLETNIFL